VNELAPNQAHDSLAMIRATEKSEESPPERPEERSVPKCSACAASASLLARSFLDTHTGKTVWLFCCQCGGCTWLD
jgi:hypothetical protein